MLWDAAVSDSGHLVIGGCDLLELAQTYGTPLYVVDRERLRKNFGAFQESFRRYHPHVEVGYSYKTNPLPGVIASLHEFGAWAEIISHFELWLALHLGVAADRIVFNGPGKTEAGLDLAVSRGIHIINVDNLTEPGIIQRLAQRYGRTQRVGVRVITSVGWSSQFGLSIRQGAAKAAFERIKALDLLVPSGLHIHLGTGIRDVAIYLQAVTEVLEFVEELRRDLGVVVNFLDLGGGFGIPTVRPFSAWDVRLMANGYAPTVMNPEEAAPLEEYARGIAAILQKSHRPDSGTSPTLFFEPGRAITSSAQCLLVRVLAVKSGGPGGSLNVILDGGKNIAMPTGYEYHEVFAAGKLNEAATAVYNLFGPLCHPGDVLFRMKTLPHLAPGDILAIMDAGAYFIPNQMNFSNPRPAAVMVQHGAARVIRDRESFENIIALDRLGEPVLSAQDTRFPCATAH